MRPLRHDIIVDTAAGVVLGAAIAASMITAAGAWAWRRWAG